MIKNISFLHRRHQKDNPGQHLVPRKYEFRDQLWGVALNFDIVYESSKFEKLYYLYAKEFKCKDPLNLRLKVSLVIVM